ncbi:MAG: bifunctional oligoribonuclease/PAP phosphatase NrnA [Anaerolineales bacterium]|nr:bifunctional oligoribonuclease/PAP phosphatase NrnA [Anaerolineales bacterium]
MTIQAIQQAVAGASNLLVISHIGPDGDSLGSLTAMGLALKQLGKQVTLLSDDGSLSRFNYLAMSDQIQQKHNTDATYDLVIAVDCGDEMRMGQAFADLPEPRPPLINIDHHITNTMFGQWNLVKPDAASTTEILYTLFKQMQVTITAEIAMSLLTGLVTDTLGFRTVSVSAHTLRIASQLVDAGADLALVTMRGLTIKPLNTVQMWREGLNHMRMENGLIWTALSQEDLRRIGYHSASSAGLVSILANVEEAVMSAVLLEADDGRIRVGLRCRPPYSVSELALNLGGGGHPLASGCTLDGPLAHAEALVVDMCKEAIAQQTRQLR